MNTTDGHTPFVLEFDQPIYAPEMRIAILRYVLDNGEKGCIGIREESLTSLQDAFSAITSKLRTDIANKNALIKTLSKANDNLLASELTTERCREEA